MTVKAALRKWMREIVKYDKHLEREKRNACDVHINKGNVQHDFTVKIRVEKFSNGKVRDQEWPCRHRTFSERG